MVPLMIKPMTLSQSIATPVILLALIAGATVPESGIASDTLRQSPRVGGLRIPLASYERIPIGTVLAHADRYQMREIRITGTVTALQTEIITNRMICGFAHEQTTLTIEDDSGQIELVERGACGKNFGQFKAPMLHMGQQIHLLVLINITNALGTPGRSVEATIRYIDLARE